MSFLLANHLVKDSLQQRGPSCARSTLGTVIHAPRSPYRESRFLTTNHSQIATLSDR